MGAPSIILQPGESWSPTMDFSARLAKGETITGVASVTVTPATVPALAIGTPSFTNTAVQFSISGGVDDTRYTVTVTVTTTGGTRVGVGHVQLQDDGEI